MLKIRYLKGEKIGSAAFVFVLFCFLNWRMWKCSHFIEKTKTKTKTKINSNTKGNLFCTLYFVILDIYVLSTSTKIRTSSLNFGYIISFCVFVPKTGF